MTLPSFFHSTWLLRGDAEPRPWWRVIVWWEVRRLPANALLGVIGLLSATITLLLIARYGDLQPGEDPIEPLLVFMAIVIFNVCYTLGWLLELLTRALVPSTPRVGPKLLGVGLLLWISLAVLPTALWGVTALSHILGR